MITKLQIQESARRCYQHALRANQDDSNLTAYGSDEYTMIQCIQLVLDCNIIAPFLIAISDGDTIDRTWIASRLNDRWIQEKGSHNRPMVKDWFVVLAIIESAAMDLQKQAENSAQAELDAFEGNHV